VGGRVSQAPFGQRASMQDHPLVLHASEFDYLPPFGKQTEPHVSGSCQDCRPVIEHRGTHV
jgi:hypothetical protein